MRNKNSLYLESEALDYEDEYDDEYEGEWDDDGEEKFYHNRYFDLYNKLYFLSVTAVIILSILYYSFHWNQLGTAFTLYYFVQLSLCYGALLLLGIKKNLESMEDYERIYAKGWKFFLYKLSRVCYAFFMVRLVFLLMKGTEIVAFHYYFAK